MELNCNEIVLVNGESFLVVGVDHYYLYNCLNQQVTWKSYTLQNKDKRVGLSFTQGQLIFWRTVDFSDFQERELFEELTGIAHIQFEGDSGPSKPFASLIWFKDRNSTKEYYLIETFFEYTGVELIAANTMFQIGEKIDNEQISSS